MAGNLVIPNVFAVQSGNVPAAELDTDYSTIRDYVNNREVTVGLIAARPAASISGRWFFATDVSGGTLYVDNGVTWTTVASPVSGGVVVQNVKSFGATGDGVTDDTTAIQNAINAAATAHGTVYLPTGTYVISRLNLTGISGMAFVGDGSQINGTILMPKAGTASYGTATGHLFDCTGSAFLSFRNFQVGAFNQTPVPTTGFFLANIASAVSNAFHFENVYVTGSYTAAACYITNVPSSDMVNCDWYNYRTGAGTFCPVKFTQSNVDALSSDFATVAASSVTADWTLMACEMHKFAGAGANNRVVLLDGAKDLRWIGGNVTGGATTYVEAQNDVDRVIFIGTTFETESEPVTPTNLFIPGTGNSDVRFLNCLMIIGGVATFGGGGSFSGGPSNNQVFVFNITAGGTVAAGVTTFLGPAGNDATEGNSRLPLSYAGILSTFNVAAGGSPGVGQTYTYTVMVNGVATALVATTTGAATTSADTSNFVNVAATDVVSIRLVTSGGATVVGGHRATIGILAAPQAAF